MLISFNKQSVYYAAVAFALILFQWLFRIVSSEFFRLLKDVFLHSSMQFAKLFNNQTS